MIPLGVDLLGGFGKAPSVIKGSIDGGEHVGLGQSAVVVTNSVNAGVHRFGDVGGGVQHLPGMDGQEVEQGALLG